MTTFVHELISNSAQKKPCAIALQANNNQLSYQLLNQKVHQLSQEYMSFGLKQGERVGIYLSKNVENVTSMFACSVIGAVFVPINPVLKAPQVKHIITDCQVKILITNKSRLKTLMPTLTQLTSLTHIIITDSYDDNEIKGQNTGDIEFISWMGFSTQQNPIQVKIITQKENDLAAILYTSGSTGKPKGIMLSHKNIVLGAKSVAQYLNSNDKDKILAVLPLSFDYGLNQLMSSFLVGAQCVLLDYLFANDVIKAIEKYEITGLAAVPPLWSQLAKIKWPIQGTRSLRYFTNSGGALSATLLKKLQSLMPQASPFLMYGLTEAFRSTYLEPIEINNKQGSMGKAIPNAEIMVINANGDECQVDELGELVHIGPLVSLGYWQNEQANNIRFKPAPKQAKNISNISLAVYSGDYVKRDKDGFLYFISRQDEMIKTSGYRISPNEVEEVILENNAIHQACVIGLPHPELGQGILSIITLANRYNSQANSNEVEKSLLKHCQQSLANYMMPQKVIILSDLPYNANGKVDRQELKRHYRDIFTRA